MSSVIARLRKTRPYLTPGFNPDDEDQLTTRLRLAGLMDETPTGGISPDRTQSDSILDSMPDRIDPVGTAPIMVRHPGERPGHLTRPSRSGMIAEPGTDRLAKEEAYANAVADYTPQKEGIGRILARTGVGLLTGGIGGATAQLAGGLMNRRGPDERWQQNELAQSEDTIGHLRGQRREGVQEDLWRSQIAQAEMTPIYDEDRNEIGTAPKRNAATIQSRVLGTASRQKEAEADNLKQIALALPDFDPVNNPQHAEINKRYKAIKGYDIPTREKKISPERSAQIGKQVINSKTYQTERDTKTGNWVLSKDADGKPIEIDRPEKPEEDVASENVRVQANIDRLQKAMEGLGSPPPTEIDDTHYDSSKNALVVVGTKVNPAYQEWQRNMDAYSKEKRDWEGKLKSPKVAPGKPRAKAGAQQDFERRMAAAKTPAERTQLINFAKEAGLNTDVVKQ